MEEIKRIVKRWNVTTQIDFMLFIVSTYPDWHCSQWLIFTAKIQNLDSNGNHNRKHADANEKHEINTYNISRKQTCIICFKHFICCAQKAEYIYIYIYIYIYLFVAKLLNVTIVVTV